MVLTLATNLSLQGGIMKPSRCIRRFSRGTLQWWPTPNTHSRLHPLQAHQLSVLLYNGLPDRASFLPPWRELPQHFQAASDLVSAAVSSPL
jgi:hypothetical protein